MEVNFPLWAWHMHGRCMRMLAASYALHLPNQEFDPSLWIACCVRAREAWTRWCNLLLLRALQATAGFCTFKTSTLSSYTGHGESWALLNCISEQDEEGAASGSHVGKGFFNPVPFGGQGCCTFITGEANLYRVIQDHVLTNLVTVAN